MGRVWQGLYGGEIFPLKGAWSRSSDPLKILNPFNISGMDEAIHCLSLASPTAGVKNFTRKGHGLVT